MDNVRMPTDRDQLRATGLEQQEASDAEISTLIRGRLTEETGIAHKNIQFTVTGGRVGVEGEIDGRVQRTRLITWLRTLSGVTDIHDGLRLVDSQAEQLSGERQSPAYGGLEEALAAQPERARRRGEATG